MTVTYICRYNWQHTRDAEALEVEYTRYTNQQTKGQAARHWSGWISCWALCWARDALHWPSMPMLKTEVNGSAMSHWSVKRASTARVNQTALWNLWVMERTMESYLTEALARKEDTWNVQGFWVMSFTSNDDIPVLLSRTGAGSGASSRAGLWPATRLSLSFQQ